jgi:hypothetical protein
VIQLKYQTELFSREFIRQFLADYQVLLEQVVANPDILLS